MQRKRKRTIDTENCVICMEQLNTKPVCKLHCGHDLHTKCLLKSIAYSSTCPVCRGGITGCQHGDGNIGSIVSGHIKTEINDVVTNLLDLISASNSKISDLETTLGLQSAQIQMFMDATFIIVTNVTEDGGNLV